MQKSKTFKNVLKRFSLLVFSKKRCKEKRMPVQPIQCFWNIIMLKFLWVKIPQNSIYSILFSEVKKYFPIVCI